MSTRGFLAALAAAMVGAPDPAPLIAKTGSTRKPGWHRKRAGTVFGRFRTFAAAGWKLIRLSHKDLPGTRQPWWRTTPHVNIEKAENPKRMDRRALGAAYRALTGRPMSGRQYVKLRKERHPLLPQVLERLGAA
jgi:hypothetical protein